MRVKPVISLSTDSEKHRLSAFINGFLSGLGLILIVWGLASLSSELSGSALLYVGLMLFGVLVFVGGGFREAYLWGRFSRQLASTGKILAKRAQPFGPSVTTKPTQKTVPDSTVGPVQVNPNRLTEEQIMENPSEKTAQETQHNTSAP